MQFINFAMLLGLLAVAIPIISILLYTAYDFHKNILRRSAMMELAAAFNYACFVSGSILVYLYLSKDAWKFSRICQRFGWAAWYAPFEAREGGAA